MTTTKDKRLIKEYLIANVVSVEDISKEARLITKNQLVVREDPKKIPHGKRGCFGLFDGHYHRDYSDLTLADMLLGPIVCYQIHSSLVDHFPELKEKKITIQQAKDLFDSIRKNLEETNEKPNQYTRIPIGRSIAANNS